MKEALEEREITEVRQEASAHPRLALKIAFRKSFSLLETFNVELLQ